VLSALSIRFVLDFTSTRGVDNFSRSSLLLRAFFAGHRLTNQILVTKMAVRQV
jgi:hypothetical protein